MSMQIALSHRSRGVWFPGLNLHGRGFRLLGTVLLLAVATWLAWSWMPSAGTGQGSREAMTGELVHWRDAGHDWLVVVDPATRELVIYDANDGRPLERLGADDGLPPVHSISTQGSQVLVTDAGHRDSRVLKLPELQLVSR